MPYKLVKRGAKTCVVNKDTGKTVPGGCHPTHKEAEKHMAALYANVLDAQKALSESDDASGGFLVEPEAGQKDDAEGPIPVHSHGCLMAILPDDIADDMRLFTHAIPDSDLGPDGREDRPHVTIRWGFTTDDADAMREALSDEGPFDIQLGKVGIFPALAHPGYKGNDKQDVVKVDVTGSDLYRLNKKVQAVAHDDPGYNYNPHATLAYVSPGAGRKYDGATDFVGRTATIDRLEFADRKGNRHQIELKGDHEMNKRATKLSLKFVDANKTIVQGTGIPFGGPIKGKDLHGEFFDKDTNFCLDWYPERPLLYHHGLDADMGIETIGKVKSWKMTDRGVWFEAQLDKSNKYYQEVSKLIDDDRLYGSSGTMPHLARVDKKSGHITQWPWIEQSLTPTPANLDADIGFGAAKFFKAAGIEIPESYQEQWPEEVKEAFGIKAVWTTAYKNDLPDSAFLYIKPGGTKDEDGKTVPRSNRFFPVKDKDGKLDEPHVKDALGRIPQADEEDVPADEKAKALKKAKAFAKKLGIEVADDKGSKSIDAIMTAVTRAKSLTAQLERFGESLKGLFEDKMGDNAQTVWSLWNTFMDVLCKLDQIEDATEGTTIQIDTEALLDASIEEYVARLRPAALEYIRDDEDDYLRSAPASGVFVKLAYLISRSDDGAIKSLAFVDHSEAVLDAVKEFNFRFEAIRALRAKAGKRISAATDSQLREIHSAMGEAHRQLGEMLNPEPVDDKKDDDSDGTDEGSSDGYMSAKSMSRVRLLRLNTHKLAAETATGD